MCSIVLLQYDCVCISTSIFRCDETPYAWILKVSNYNYEFEVRFAKIKISDMNIKGYLAQLITHLDSKWIKTKWLVQYGARLYFNVKILHTTYDSQNRILAWFPVTFYTSLYLAARFGIVNIISFRFFEAWAWTSDLKLICAS